MSDPCTHPFIKRPDDMCSICGAQVEPLTSNLVAALLARRNIVINMPGARGGPDELCQDAAREISRLTARVAELEAMERRAESAEADWQAALAERDRLRAALERIATECFDHWYQGPVHPAVMAKEALAGAADETLPSPVLHNFPPDSEFDTGPMNRALDEKLKGNE